VAGAIVLAHVMLNGTQSDGAPLVSVVVPTKDRPQLLAVTLRTICRQEAVPLEIVVVDDGSKDAEAIDSVVAQLKDARIRVLRQPSAKGVSAARNRGLEATVGDWSRSATTTIYGRETRSSGSCAPWTKQDAAGCTPGHWTSTGPIR
jgi:Glycosyl transferase family 2